MSRAAQTAAVEFSVFGSGARIVVSDPDRLDEAAAVVRAELDLIDATLSRFRPDSELSRLNAQAGRRLRVSALFAEALADALAAARATDGLVDPTVGGTLRRIGYDKSFELLPSDGEALRLRRLRVPGWTVVELDRHAGTVRTPEGVELDLGATGKALAADRAAAAAAAACESGVIVSLGGDMAASGSSPEGGWTVLLAEDHAGSLDAPGPKVTITGGGLATSGTTTRTWKRGGVELHHIVDPRSGLPAVTPWRAVSVAAPTCVKANAAATAAVILGEAAPDWLDARRLPARLVADGGAVRHAGGWPADE